MSTQGKGIEELTPCVSPVETAGGRVGWGRWGRWQVVVAGMVEHGVRMNTGCPKKKL